VISYRRGLILIVLALTCAACARRDPDAAAIEGTAFVDTDFIGKKRRVVAPGPQVPDKPAPQV